MLQARIKTFAYLSAYTWRRVWLWLRHKRPHATVAELRRRYLRKWWPDQDGVVLFNPATVSIIRYRYLGNIPTPWATTTASAA